VETCRLGTQALNTATASQQCQGRGGGESTCPAAACLTSLLSLTVLPLKKGRSWVCPTREEEGTLNLSPGDIAAWEGRGCTWGLEKAAFLEKGPFWLRGRVVAQHV
jgi:hypothetical protein